MRVKTILLLAAVTVPAFFIAVLLPAPGTGTQTAEHGGIVLLPDLKPHENVLAQVVVTGPDGTVTLTRTPVAGKPGIGWGMKEKGGYPVPPNNILPVIDALASLHGVAPKTAQPALYPRLDLGDAGKSSQAHLLVLSDAKGGALGSIVLGKRKEASGATGAERIYARVPGSNPQTWLAAPVVNVPAGSLDWLDRSVFEMDTDKLKEVVLTQPGKPPLQFERAKPGDKLAVFDVPAGRKLKSDTTDTDLTDALGGLNFDDVKPESQLAGDAAGSVHLVMFDGSTADMTLRRDNGQTWATVTASGTKAADAIAAHAKGWAYEIPADRATTLTETMDGLLEDAKK
jgi:hypothetical protein